MKLILKKYFGFEKFRSKQEEIIKNVINGNDTFVLMPTGGGKSLCYQLPAIKLPGIALVISPLISLMKDQVDSLQTNGIKAEFINSTLSPMQYENICNQAQNGKIKILYIAPERFGLNNFQNFLKTLNINLIAIDEAHCISEWGHDFRPAYRNLNQLKKIFPSVPFVALTATATMKVRKDILTQLNLNNPRIFISSFHRKNLIISVIEKKNAFSKLINLLNKYKNKSVIIYCFSRKETEEITENLKLNNFSVRAYHAGLEKNKRKAIQELFIKDKINIIVATIAFGMGIDKPDVRLVVHYSFPKTLEGYYQEIGRAGRDGLLSECVMFYTYADTRKHKFFINKIENNATRQQAEEKLNEVLSFAELSSCRKKYLLNYFGENFPDKNCGSCDNCLTKKELFDATIISKKIFSAIIRSGSRFGINYIIDILLGKQTQRIKRNNHDNLSVFGIVNNFNSDELKQIINNLINLNYLVKNLDQYPILSLTHSGIQFLSSNKKIKIPKPHSDISPSKTVAKANLDYNSDLFELLRIARKKIADHNNIPPFIVFGDATLQEMAFYLPADKNSFSRINGVGEKKLNQFSDIFLKIINNFSHKNNLKPIKIPSKTNKINKIIRIKRTKYYDKTKELLIKKISIKDIAQHQNLSIGTIINHIEKLLDSEEKLDLNYLKLPSDRFKIMTEAFSKIGNEKLKPVFEYLNKKYSYDELRLVRVLLQN